MRNEINFGIVLQTKFKYNYSKIYAHAPTEDANEEIKNFFYE